jgi:hypothetical protein
MMKRVKPVVESFYCRLVSATQAAILIVQTPDEQDFVSSSEIQKFIYESLQP